VQGAAHGAILPSVKIWTPCVREKACAHNHSYTVNREHITFADIIQHSTPTPRFHDTTILQYTVNLTIDTIQSMKLIKVHFWFHCQSSKYYYDISSQHLTFPKINPNKFTIMTKLMQIALSSHNILKLHIIHELHDKCTMIAMGTRRRPLARGWRIPSLITQLSGR